ncbi:hypothetical protein IKG06_01975 [Candidatus Saccharibacteria bacterium]|nr:hypothetical protein [Candidatus Saccharibacteria bacterium]
MELSNFGILMAIFATCVLIVGLYMFSGHKIGLMTLRPAFKNLSKEQWKNIGKWTMIVSVIIFAIAVVGFVFNI